MKTMSTLFFLFKTRDIKKPQWPSCNNPKTLSFREASAANDDEMFKTVNSVFLDPLSAAEGAAAEGVEVETPESLFTNSAESTSLSTESFEDSGRVEPLESVISKVVRSDRMFFEPAGNTKFILEEEEDLEEAKTTTADTTKGARGGEFRFIKKKSVALEIESEDPYADFKNSMEEMVESHGLKDWECLEELLGWYLKVNAKSSHGFIIGAFVDLLVSISSSSSSTSNCISESITSYYSSSISSLSSPSSPSCSSSRGEEEIGVIDKQTRINSR